MTPSAGNIKIINMPNVDNIRTKATADNSLQDSSTDFQLHRNISLHPKNTLKHKCNTYQGKPASRENITTALIIMFEQTKQIIMDIDAITHSKTLHDKILKSGILI